MGKKSKDRAGRRKGNRDFRARLRKYSELLELIELDYTNDNMLPKMPTMGADEEFQTDIFKWDARERTDSYLRKVAKRLAGIQALKKELYSILEQVPKAVFR